ncbi:MAG: FAD-binding oxidoreductase [Geminicoccaceae bacterium]
MSVVQELRERLGAGEVLTGEDEPQRNLNDWGGLGPTRPLAVVRPRTVAEVVTVMQVCHAHRQAVVPQGGLTGLCGGGRAGSDEIALSLERLSGIEDVDPATATMLVRAGTPLQQVQEAADSAGFFFPLDLGARGSCAIGGNLSTNAGGNRVIRYGMTRDMVLGIEAVLPDGTLVSALNRMIKNNAGYDLKQLFIGSEGTLGIITRAVLRLQPKPACTEVAFCGLASYADVLALLQGARRGLGPMLSVFEVMWSEYVDLVTSRSPDIRHPLAERYPFSVLVEMQGTDETLDHARFEGWLERMLEEGVIADAVVARSTADVRRLWAIRDATGMLRTWLGPDAGFDIGLPVARMDEYVGVCRDALRARFRDVVSLFYGHIGDGNMHITAHVPGVEQQPKAEVERIVYDLVRDFGGTVSAEHGIGTAKRPWLGHARGEAEMALMGTIKRAVDPQNILNPGKVLGG